jgi:hypothetical protein
MQTNTIFHKQFEAELFCLAFFLLPGLTGAAPLTSDWRNDEVCGKSLPKFEVTKADSCQSETYCSKVDTDTRICACQFADEAESGNTDITLEYKGEVKKKWKTEIMPMTYGPASFRVDEFGLNQTGKKEFLFGVMAEQSNGMGVQNWSVWSISEGQVSAPIEMHDYGIMSFATRAKGRQTCQLLVTQWDHGRHDGLYITGRWYNLVQGKFVSDISRPMVSRRYLFSLEKQRSESITAGKPLRWYASENAKPAR